MGTKTRKGKANQVRTGKSRGRRRGDAALARKPAGIGAYVAGLLLKGKSTEEILALVDAHFPGSHTSQGSVAWYRSKLHRQGKL